MEIDDLVKRLRETQPKTMKDMSDAVAAKPPGVVKVPIVGKFRITEQTKDVQGKQVNLRRVTVRIAEPKVKTKAD